MSGKRTRDDGDASWNRTDGDDERDGRFSSAFRGDGRGQMLLVGAVVMGFMLVVLVLVLNSLLFAQNVESGGIQSDAPESADARDVVETELGRLMIGVNDKEGSASDVRDNFTANASTTLELWERQEFHSGAASADATVNSSSIEMGYRIRQTNGSDFTSAGGANNWSIASGADGVRRFQFDVETSSLGILSISTVSEGDTITGSELTALRTTAFHANITTASDDWRVFLYEEDTTGNLVVATETVNGSDTAVVRYVGDVSSATVDVTTGSVDEEQTGTADRVDLFQFAGGQSGSYGIWYKNGDAIEGNYTMTLDAGLSDVEDGNLNSDGPSPYYTAAVYSTDVRLSYATKQITSDAKFEVAPCSTDQLRCEAYGVTDPW